MATWLFVGVAKGRKAVRFGFRKPKVKFSWWKNRALGRWGCGGGKRGNPEQTIPELETLNIAGQLSPPPPPIFDPSWNRVPGI